jgi:hypothetical protein
VGRVVGRLEAHDVVDGHYGRQRRVARFGNARDRILLASHPIAMAKQKQPRGEPMTLGNMPWKAVGPTRPR